MKPWCNLSLPSTARLITKSKSGRLAMTISRPSCASQERHWRDSRSCSCFAKRRKVQNPAKLCAIGEATRSNLSLFPVVNVTGAANKSDKQATLFLFRRQDSDELAALFPLLVRHSFLRLVARRLGLSRNDPARFRIDQNLSDIADARLCDIEGPNKMASLVLDLRAFD